MFLVRSIRRKDFLTGSTGDQCVEPQNFKAGIIGKPRLCTQTPI